MLSIWEKESFVNYNYIIIGSGIVGLNVAICLKQKHPNSSVLIVERGLLPTGASTKNAGFACMGSPTELLEDLQTQSVDELVQLFELRVKGLERTQNLLDKQNIGYAQNGSFELLDKNNLQALDKLDMLNTILKSVTGNKNAFTVNDAIIEHNKFNKTKVVAAIQNNLEGELHTGMLVKALLLKAQSMGVEVKTGATLIEYNTTNKGLELIIQPQLKLHANKLIFCTNAFTNNLIPSLDINAGRGQVLITKPIPNLSFKGIYHMGSGYYYFREFNNCVLFGGGRNMDFATENTTEFGSNEAILQNLKHILQETILPNTPHEIDYTWSGIMAFGATKKPIIQQHNNNVYLCVRMGGMGVAIGSQVAWQLVEDYF